MKNFWMMAKATVCAYIGASMALASLWFLLWLMAGCIGCAGTDIGVSAEKEPDGGYKVELELKKDLPVPEPVQKP